MHNFNRRDFLKTSAGVLGATTLGTLGCAKKETAQQWPGFKYAMCNESMKGMPWEKQCAIIANAGFKGVEIAPFTLVKEGVQEISADQRKQMVAAMKNAGIECAGLHWLLAPPPKGLHFTTPDKALRKKSVDYLNSLVDFCGDLGGTAMIFGSPKQRNTIGISIDEAKKYFTEGLAQTADHAQRRGVKILIEPLDKTQTDVLNTLAEALVMIKEINHPAIQTMFDFHNTPDETEAFDVLIKKYYEYIYHVHVQEMDGDYLGTGTATTDFVKAFQTLKDLDFKHWVSLEVFNFKPAPETIAGESMKSLKKIEEKLV